MVHLCGAVGKGTNTAAMGMALRMAGRGKRGGVAQFLKGADSGERYARAMLPQVALLPLPERVKFSFQLTPEEREAEQARYLALVEQARTLGAQPDCGLLVLDEVCAAVNTGLRPLGGGISCLDRAAGGVVRTGRDPDPALVGRADYITEMGKLRHPFDLGTAARPGVGE